MKKTLIIPLIVLALTFGLLVACDAESLSEPTPPPTPEPILVVTEPEQTSEPSQEPVQESTTENTPEQTQENAPPEPDYAISLADIVGDWILSHSVNEAGEVGMPVESDWLTYTLEILADSSFFWQVYGSLRGDLTQIDDYTFEASNLVAQSEGMTWYPEADIVTITYIPETDQLRFYREHLYENGPTADPLRIYYERG